MLFVAGLTVGTVTERVPEAASRRAGEYWILAAGFHVHAFPGDGALPPWALRHEAARNGLDVFAITNHNRVSTARLARWMSRQSDGPIVLVGQEVTARTFHLIAAGIEERVDWRASPLDVIRAVHAQGGIAIAAHPVGRFLDAWDEAAIGTLDGYDRAHPAVKEKEVYARDLEWFDQKARTIRPRLAPMGSSDFHWTGNIGSYRTFVFARERSAAGVLDAVRNGRTVAADANGRLYGDATLVHDVEMTGGVIGAKEDIWRRPSIVAVWLGLLGMVVLA
jgi:predicted metal-dependent phosphoesterase TrpH